MPRRLPANRLLLIVSLNFYYARPGLEGEVLQQRLRACEVRRAMGLPRGRVMRRTAGGDGLPDVIWQLEFEHVAGHHADMAARAASPEFEAVRARMRELCRRFERPLFETDAAASADEMKPATTRVVALDWVFCEPQKTPQVLALLDHYGALYAARGFDRGRLLRLIAAAGDLPQIVWQREYADPASHALMQMQLASCAALQTWLPIVSKLAHAVQPSLWHLE